MTRAIAACALLCALLAPAHADARPRAWCGWWMRQQVSRDPGPAFNLARLWARFGAAAHGPAPGVIGVMPHHVFKVVKVVGPHRVLAISGNDGHAVRTRVRTTSRVIAWRRDTNAMRGTIDNPL